MSERKLRVHLTKPLAHQEPVFVHPARNKVVVAGRRWGKTTLCMTCALQGHGPTVMRGGKMVPYYPGAMRGARIWWLAPVYSQSTGVWAGLKAACAPRGAREYSTPGAWIRKSEVERTIWFPGGGSISVKTADDPDNLRGASLDGVILDEAAFMKEETWTQVLRPSLFDREGWAFFISTPKGLNWFHDLFESSAVMENWQRWQQPTWANPLIPASEIENMRNDPRVSPLEFQQEVVAEFLVAGAGMFRWEWARFFTQLPNGDYSLAHEGEVPRMFAESQIQKFATVDLAVSTKSSADFTVIATWGVTPHRDLVLLDVDRGRYEGPDQLARIWDAYRRWRPSYVGIERTGYQLAIIQQASREGLPVRELTPLVDKVARALTAQAYMEKGKVWFPTQPWMEPLKDELVSFPVGAHDDFVDTLSYAAGEVASSRFEPVVAPVGLGQSNPWDIR